MEEELSKKLGLPILARVVAVATTGVSPDLMGIGPISATQKVLEKAGLTVSDIDLFEINEAFAAQCVACQRTLGIDEDKLNVNGGGISLGHPVGATGSRLVVTLLYELKRRGGKYGPGHPVRREAAWVPPCLSRWPDRDTSMKNFTFSFPTQVIFGRDAETHAGALSAPFGPNVMLLYGSDRIRRSGLLGRLTADLEAHGLTVTLFGGIQENPVLSTAEEGRRLAKEKKITLLLAVGGGSVIDTAKAISLGAKNSVPLWELYSGKAQTQRALPIGVVLTTAATASEANGVSVLCHDVLHEKAALDEPLTRPRFALMNPVLTYTLPPRQTASCAVDIFSHAFERYFHKG